MRQIHPIAAAVLGSAVTFTLTAVLVSAAPAPAPSFSREVAPLLQQRCAGCHGERLNLGGYRLQTFENLMKSGVSGKPAVVPGKPESSRLYQLLITASPTERMPKGDEPFTTAQKQLVRRWIAAGAKFDGSDTAAPLRTLQGPRVHPAAPVSYRTPVPVLALAFVDGGKQIATGAYREVTLWDVATGKLTRRIGNMPQRIQSLALSPDGTSLLAAGGDPGDYGELTLLPVAGGKPRVLDTWNDVALAAAFDQEGKLAAAGASDGSVRVYEVATGKRRWSARVHSDWVTGVSFSADGKYVASSGKDMVVKVYEAATGALFATYNGHNRQLGKYRGQAPVYAVHFLPGSPLAISAGGGKWLQLWEPEKAKAEAGDAGDMEERFQKPSHARYVEHGLQREILALQVRDGFIFAAGADGVITQLEMESGKRVKSFQSAEVAGADPGQADWLYGLDYDASTRRVASGSYRGEVRVWDLTSGKLLTTIRNQPQTR